MRHAPWVMGRLLRTLDLCLATLIGFSFSFTVFFFLAFIPLGSFLRGAILEETDTLRTIHLLEQNDRFAAATAALGSFWWWSGVVIASVLVTSYLLRGLRR